MMQRLNISDSFRPPTHFDIPHAFKDTHTHARTLSSRILSHTHYYIPKTLHLSLSLSLTHTHTHTLLHPTLTQRNRPPHTLALIHTLSRIHNSLFFSDESFEIYANTNVFHISSDQINNTIFHVVLIH